MNEGWYELAAKVARVILRRADNELVEEILADLGYDLTPVELEDFYTWFEVVTDDID